MQTFPILQTVESKLLSKVNRRRAEFLSCDEKLEHLGAIQVLRNADRGGVSNCPGKNVTKV